MTKTYSQKEVDEIIKQSFNAARELLKANSDREKLRRDVLKEDYTLVAKFETVEDYLKSL